MVDHNRNKVSKNFSQQKEQREAERLNMLHAFKTPNLKIVLLFAFSVVLAVTMIFSNAGSAMAKNASGTGQVGVNGVATSSGSDYSGAGGNVGQATSGGDYVTVPNKPKSTVKGSTGSDPIQTANYGYYRGKTVYYQLDLIGDKDLNDSSIWGSFTNHITFHYLSQGVNDGIYYILFQVTCQLPFSLDKALTYIMLQVLNFAYSYNVVNQLISAIKSSVVNITGIRSGKFSSAGIFGGFMSLLTALTVIYTLYLFVVRRATISAFSGILKTVVVLTVALGFFSNYSTILKGMNTMSTQASSMILSQNVGVSTDGHGHIQKTTALQKMDDEIFNMFVFRPWLQLEFGTSNFQYITSPRAWKIISKNPNSDARHQALIDDIKSHNNQYLTNSEVSYRGALMSIILILNGIDSLPIYFLAVTLVICQFWFLIIAMVAPYALLWSAFPGQFRVMKRYLLELILPLAIKMIVAVSALMLFGMIDAITTVANVNQASMIGLILTALIQTTLLITAFLLRKRIMSIFAAGSGFVSNLREGASGFGSGASALGRSALASAHNLGGRGVSANRTAHSTLKNSIPKTSAKDTDVSANTDRVITALKSQSDQQSQQQRPELQDQTTLSEGSDDTVRPSMDESETSNDDETGNREQDSNKTDSDNGNVAKNNSENMPKLDSEMGGEPSESSESDVEEVQNTDDYISDDNSPKNLEDQDQANTSELPILDDDKNGLGNKPNEFIDLQHPDQSMQSSESSAVSSRSNGALTGGKSQNSKNPLINRMSSAGNTLYGDLKENGQLLKQSPDQLNTLTPNNMRNGHVSIPLNGQRTINANGSRIPSSALAQGRSQGMALQPSKMNEAALKSATEHESPMNNHSSLNGGHPLYSGSDNSNLMQGQRMMDGSAKTNPLQKQPMGGSVLKSDREHANSTIGNGLDSVPLNGGHPLYSDSGNSNPMQGQRMEDNRSQNASLQTQQMNGSALRNGSEQSNPMNSNNMNNVPLTGNRPHSSVPNSNPMQAQKITGTHAQGTSLQAQPMNGSALRNGFEQSNPLNGTSLDNVPLNGSHPLYSAPGNSNPMQGKRMEGGHSQGSSLNTQPMQGSRSMAQPIQASPLAGSPAKSSGMNNNSQNNVPLNGRPLSENDMNNNSVRVQPVSGSSLQGSPIQDNPMINRSMNNNSLGTNSSLMDNSPIQSNPIGGQTMRNTPVQGNPMRNSSMQNNSLTGSPITEKSMRNNDSLQGNPLNNNPMRNTPTRQAGSLRNTPLQGNTMAGTSMQNRPVQTNPIQQDVPMNGQPLKGSPENNIPIQKQPMQGGQPMRNTPQSNESLRHVPLQNTPLQGAPIPTKPIYSDPIPTKPVQGDPWNGGDNDL